MYRPILTLLVIADWSRGGHILFPSDEETSNSSTFSRLRWSTGDRVKVLDDLPSDRSAKSAQTKAIMSSRVFFPSLSTGDHDVGVTTASAEFFPTEIDRSTSFSSPFDISHNVVQAMFPQKMCDCLPVNLCVNQSAINFITTRVITKPPEDTVCLPGHVYCCIENKKLGCGIPNVIPGVNPKEGQANLGQHPWSVIILTHDNNYVGGGVLIGDKHILTVAHRVVKYSASRLKARLGDWDIAQDTEPVKYLEVKIGKIDNHPQFEMKTLKNDISVITLETPVSTLTKPYPQINSICLPDFTMIFTGLRCKVAGWGKDQFNGHYQNIIKEVEVPVLSSMDCQSKLRSTKLGNSFVLDTNSFICAGGESGKDACTGDGGNALACMKDGKIYVAGLTAAGLGCGNSNTPGLYVNTVNYLTWIKAVIDGNDEISINPRGSHL